MRVAKLELHLTVIDKGEPRQRWNGAPMASHATTEALLDGIDALEEKVEALGLELARVSYGVTAEDV